MQKSQMKWDDLRVFLHVAQAARISVAGAALGLDPATVSRRMAALEAALGARLFDRSPRGYALTDEGHKLMTHAQSVEATLAEATRDVGLPTDTLSGTVRIGAPDGVATYLLPKVCATIRQAHPGVSLQVVSLPRVFNLSRREADLAISISPPTTGRLKVRKIASYTLGLYAARDFLDRHPITRLEDVRDLPGVGYIGDMVFDKALDYDKALGRSSDPALSSNNMMVQLQWTLQGAGLCVLHEFVARAHPNLVRVLPDEINLRRSYHLVRHQDDDRVPRVARVADMIADGIRDALG